VFGHLQTAVPRQRASQGNGEFAHMLAQGSNHSFRFLYSLLRTFPCSTTVRANPFLADEMGDIVGP
jgi:hypothetical protein